jgi:hypothetical protein
MIFVYILGGISVTLFIISFLLYLTESKQKTYTINCDYNLLCKSIIDWAIGNIPPIKSGHRLSVKVSTYEHKRTMAVFFPYQKEIKIYVKNHDTVDEIVDSLLHEVTHYKQYIRSPKSNMKEYQKLLGLYGYDNHPHEVEANNTARNYSKDCLEYLNRNGFIISL